MDSKKTESSNFNFEINILNFKPQKDKNKELYAVKPDTKMQVPPPPIVTFDGSTYIIQKDNETWNRYIKKENKLSKIGKSITDKAKTSRFQERIEKKYNRKEQVNKAKQER